MLCSPIGSASVSPSRFLHDKKKTPFVHLECNPSSKDSVELIILPATGAGFLLEKRSRFPVGQAVRASRRLNNTHRNDFGFPKMVVTLDRLRAGQKACIVAVRGNDALAQRLLEMGLLDGEEIEVVGFAPMGDPLQIRLGDSYLSLRLSEAARVMVHPPDLGFLMNTVEQRHTKSNHLTVALVGNPNTGKTTLFNALSGMRQRVGNYPGVTVEIKKGRLYHQSVTYDLVDLPGTYSLAPRSPDEMMAVDLLLGRLENECRPDVVVCIVDASNLERNLYLTSQVLEMDAPVVVALNMIDVAQRQGIRIDAKQVSERLGVPVVPIQANKETGLDQLKSAIAKAIKTGFPLKKPVFPEAFDREVKLLSETFASTGTNIPLFLVRRLLLDVGGFTEQRLSRQASDWKPLSQDSDEEKGDTKLAAHLQAARQRLAEAGYPVPAVEVRTRYAWIREALDGCIQRPSQRPVTWTDRLDRVLTHKVWGLCFFGLLMFLVFQSIFTWARPLTKVIVVAKDFLAEALQSRMEPGPLTSLLTEGVLEGLGTVLAFLPQIVILFGFIAILEECGYMARAAFVMDKLMSRCGLNGKSFIPLLSSLGCAVPGIMATRVIENRRDRLATILVAPLMSCSARLPVYMLLIGAFLSVHSPNRAADHPWWLPGVVLFAVYALGLIAAPLMALLLKRTLLRGETPMFIMEMPTYKLPSWHTVLLRMKDGGGVFIRRAGTIILASMILVWAMLYFPCTDEQGRNYEQLIARHEETVLKLKEKQTEWEQIDNENKRIHQLQEQWKSRSILGRMGRAIEPLVRPLGWDWRIGMAVLASFPARENVIGTLGIIYEQGEVDAEGFRDFSAAAKSDLALSMSRATWDSNPQRKIFTVPTALSLMVFFALCCQCASTLAVVKQETKSWRWPAFTFAYMTTLAYLGALLTYQVGSWIAGM